MATVPGILYLGGYHAQGGAPGFDARVFVPIDSAGHLTYLSKLLDRDLMRVVPDDASSGNPTAASLSFWPWYDPTGNSDQFTVSSATAGATGYDVNNSGGYAAGSTSIVLDGGSGTISAGDRVKFAGHSTWYPVDTGVSGGSGTLILSTALTSSVADTEEMSVATKIVFSGSPGWTTDEHVGRLFTAAYWTTPYFGISFSHRVTIVSNTAGTVFYSVQSTLPTVGAPCWVGVGQLTDYHAAPAFLHTSEVSGALYSTRGGSQSSGSVGTGPDASMIRRLWEDHFTTTPYFLVMKYPLGAGMMVSYADSPNNAGRAGLLAEIARCEAAATERGHTIDWQFCVFDHAAEDAAWAVSNAVDFVLYYRTRLDETIAWLRSSAVMNDATAKFAIVNHREEIWNVSAAGAILYANQNHRALAASDDYVQIVDIPAMGDRIRFGDDNDTPGSEKKYYSFPTYLAIGEEMADTIGRLNTAADVATPLGALPVYCYIGDSIAVGAATSAWTLALASESISGPNPPSLLRPSNQLIYNRGTAVLEVYEPHTNSNTSGSTGGTAYAAHDLSIMAELGELHPNGFAMVKRASYSSALATELSAYDGSYNGGRWLKSVGEHYPELQSDYAGATAYINGTLDKQVDFRGFFVVLGTNDAATAGGGAAFASALGTFCDDLWDDFSTRTGGTKFPIIWRRPQTEASTAIAAEVAAIRAALAAQALAETQFVSVDFDALERLNSDDLHETPDSSIAGGRLMTAALARVAI